MQQPELRLNVHGSGDIDVQGQVQHVTVQVAGSGDVHAGQLRAQDVTCSVAGSGDAVVLAEKSVHASVAGSGSIRVLGAPPVRRTHVVGSGDIWFG